MKVKHVVSEHRKGVKARKYPVKPKKYIDPTKPETKQELSENTDTYEQGLAQVYNQFASSVEKYKDEQGAEKLYHALAQVAKQHGKQTEFKHMLNGARHSARMDYDTNPGGFENWFWYIEPWVKGERSMDEDPSQQLGSVSQVKPDGSIDVQNNGQTQNFQSTDLTKLPDGSIGVNTPKVTPGMKVVSTPTQESLAAIKRLSGL
jgi:hypothetical protein